MRCEYDFYVYTMQSASRRGLYIDMTNNLYRRVWHRKAHVFEGFTDDYPASYTGRASTMSAKPSIAKSS
jgi:predicted GIY-YIG superfamily endonuclease